MTPEEQLKQLQQQLDILKTQKEIADLQAGMQQKPAEVQQAIAQAESAAAAARKATLEAIVPKGESKPREGSVTTDEKFGYLATLVAYQVMRTCAATVAKTISDKPLADGPARILIVDERNVAQGDLALVQVERQFDLFGTQFDAGVRQLDHLQDEMKANYPPAAAVGGLEVQGPDTEAGQLEFLPAAGVASFAAAAPAIVSSVADIIGFFKTDYTVTGQTVDLSGDALVAEVAGRITRHHVQIFNFNLVRESGLVNRWSQLVEKKLSLSQSKGAVETQVVQPLTARIAAAPAARAALQAQLDPLITTDEAQRAALRKELAELQKALRFDEDFLRRAQGAISSADTLAQAFTEFTASLTTAPDASTPPLWLQAAVRQQIRQQEITHLLYLKIVSSGGEAITKKSFWRSGQTSYLGGAVVTYVLATIDGKVELAGSEVSLGQLDHQYSQPTATTLRAVPLG